MVKPEDQVRDPNTDAIQKVGAAVVLDGRVLVVRKKDQPSPEYYMAGGRMEEGETQRETLFRELDEELGVQVIEYEYLGTYEDQAVFEGTPLILHAYYVRISGEPAPANEIKEYAWIGSDFTDHGYEVSSIMARRVIPRLVELGRL